MVTANPGQLRLERAEHVEERPRDDDHVVCGEQERDHHCGQPSAWKRLIRSWSGN